MTSNRSAAAPTFESLESALKHFFGYDRFRSGQQPIIQAALENRDQLVIMPTGGGKSLCFQLPALVRPGLTVVVSPLIALMQDQVQALHDNGIGATFLNSTLSLSELRQREAAILAGHIKLLYLAPERLLGEGFLPFLDRVHEQTRILSFAIDEAHCVSEWGHDFRPEYRQLRGLRRRYPTVPMMALTATATERVRQDIVQQLGLKSASVHVASFNRPNLFYEIRPKQKQSYLELLKLVKQTAGAGIIYCLSRKKVDEITFRLQQDGIEALSYHAGLADGKRADNQNRFIRDDVRVMVATIAFGMGINKPDVRFVIHYDLPRNLESYYQESGRAGRDGEAARCTFFFSYGDVKSIDYIIAQKVDPQTGEPLEEEQQIARQQLRQVIDYAEGTDCRRRIQLAYFGERFEGNCGNCDNCLSPKPTQDWTIEAQKFLSCVARCKERFGMKYIVDVLRGSKDKRILQNGHDQLSTYGIGRDRTADEWRLLGRSLLHQGLVDETSDGYSILRLNPLSWDVLRKQRSVYVAAPQRITPEIVEDGGLRADIDSLFERLRSLRKQVADEQSVPPYVVFADSSLRLMAQQQPQTLEEFAKISGVGSYKRDQYGQRFIEAIRRFCQEQGIPLRDIPTAVADVPTTATPVLARTHFYTLELHQQGLTPPDIAEKRKLSINTIVDHLELLLEARRQVTLETLVPLDRQMAIQQAIEEVGSASLRVIRDRLGETYDYTEIRLVRAAWRQPSP